MKDDKIGLILYTRHTSMINHLILHANIHIQDTHMHTRIKRTHAQKSVLFSWTIFIAQSKRINYQASFQFSQFTSLW